MFLYKGFEVMYEIWIIDLPSPNPRQWHSFRQFARSLVCLCFCLDLHSLPCWQPSIWGSSSSGMLRRAALVRTEVSEEGSTSFIRVTRICELRTLEVTNNRRTLRRNTTVSFERSGNLLIKTIASYLDLILRYHLQFSLLGCSHTDHSVSVTFGI
jgi:hypothetical protein